jgi:hypothetical protein
MAAIGAPERRSWTTFIEAHRARVTSRRNVDERDQVLIYARDPAVLRWIDHELFGERLASTVVGTLTDVVANLTLTPPPWPRYLIIDSDDISAADIRLLASIREAGWPGVVLAIGDAPRHLHQSLGVDISVPRNFEYEALRNELKRARSAASSLHLLSDLF